MYYLSACYKSLLKSYYYYVLFLPFKKCFNCYEKYFSFHLYIFLKKKFLLTNIRNVIKEVNLYFSDVIEMAKFFLQLFIIFNMITDSFLVEKWGNQNMLGGASTETCQLSGKHLFWHFSSCLKIKNHLERVSPSHFLQSVLIEISMFF